MRIIDVKLIITDFYREGVNYYSIGELSDNFIKALMGLYKTDSELKKMNDKIVSTTFVFDGSQEILIRRILKLKFSLMTLMKKDFIQNGL